MASEHILRDRLKKTGDRVVSVDHWHQMARGMTVITEQGRVYELRERHSDWTLTEQRTLLE